MIAFEITVDGEPQPTVGMEDWCVLSAIVSAVRGRDGDEPDIDLAPGGLTRENEEGVAHHFRWKRTPLRVGSTITLCVVDVDSLPPPQRVYRSDREVREAAFTDEEIEAVEREEFARLKAKFEPEPPAG